MKQIANALNPVPNFGLSPWFFMALALNGFPACPLAGNPTQTTTFQTEKKTMTFVNEKITDTDKAMLASKISYEKMLKIDRFIMPYDTKLSSLWTVDRARGAFLVHLTGGGRDRTRYDYYALGIDDQVVLLGAVKNFKKSQAGGLDFHFIVQDLYAPKELEHRLEDIKQLIREALEEKVFCDPTADGGTYANPNLVARKNITSFNIEFK